MNKILRLLPLIWGAAFILSCSHKEKIIPRDIASLRASGVEGIWFLQGTSSTRGPYNGELELRPAQDGTYNVVRTATYINSYFDGLKIQEVWTGKAVPTEQTLTITYDLKQADFISELDGEKRSESEFTNSISVISQFVPEESGLRAEFSDKKVSQYSEWLTTKRDLEAQPLWQDQRQLLPSQGKTLAPSLQAQLKKYKSAVGFEKKSLYQKYKNRVEFKNEQAAVVFDPTDFEFYRKNKDVIRVNNKILDKISITESVVRRNAYSPSLAEKQRGFEANTKDFHLNEWGLVSYAHLDNKGRFQGFLADEDAILISSFYLSSQAIRYQVTTDKEALFNVRRVLAGLFTAIQVAEQTGSFPRALMTNNPNEKLYPGWRQAKEPMMNLNYLEGGDEETAQGILHGLTAAALIIPVSEIETWNKIKAALVTLENIGAVRDNRENFAIIQGLHSIYKNDGPSKDAYRQAYMKAKTSAPSALNTMYWRGHGDWRKVNATVLSKVSEILIADFLQEPGLRDSLREDLLNQWTYFEDSEQHAFTLAAYNFAYRHGVRSTTVKAADFEKSFTAALERARWGLRAIPFPRPNLNVEIDRSLDPNWVASPTPKEFWKQNGVSHQGLIAYPAFELESFSSPFIWNSSEFNYKVSHKKEFEESGVDYLYGYWLARQANFLTGQERE